MNRVTPSAPFRQPPRRLPAAVVLSLPLLLSGLTGCTCRTTDCRLPRPSSPEAPPTGSETSASGKPRPAILLTDVAAEAGLVHPVICGTPQKPWLIDTNGTGGAVLDYDGDGRMDLYVVNGATLEDPERGGPPDRLYRNLANGKFEDVTAKAGLDDRAYGSGVLAFDPDGDGDPDLLVTDFPTQRFYRNDGGRFVDATKESGLSGSGWSMGAAAADFDGDGDLDLFVAHYVVLDPKDPPRNTAQGGDRVCQWKGVDVACGPVGLPAEQSRYYRNEGQGRFVDATEEAGFTSAPPAYGMGTVAIDADFDGKLDVYVADDAMPNHLWRNLGGGKFEEAARELGLAVGRDGVPRSGMGIAVGDTDGDGREEIFVTNFSDQENSFFRTEGDGIWEDVGHGSGLGTPSYTRLGWGTTFFDVDSDGDLDLFVANGHVYPEADRADPSTGFRQKSQLYLNDGNGRFTEAPADGALAVVDSFRGAARVDFDDDGDSDLLVVRLDAPPMLLRNDSLRSGHWLGIDLRGKAPNVDAANATVEVRTAGRILRGTKRLGSSYMSSEDPRLLFAIGEATAADVEITWPDGTKQRIEGMAADGYRIVRQ